MESSKVRDEKGHFVKGCSGNPGHKFKNPTAEEFRKWCQEESQEALNKILEIMVNPESKKSEQLQAAMYIIDRGYGKPKLEIEATALFIPPEYQRAKLVLEKYEALSDDELKLIAEGENDDNENG